MTTEPHGKSATDTLRAPRPRRGARRYGLDEGCSATSGTGASRSIARRGSARAAHGGHVLVSQSTAVLVAEEDLRGCGCATSAPTASRTSPTASTCSLRQADTPADAHRTGRPREDAAGGRGRPDRRWGRRRWRPSRVAGSDAAPSRRAGNGGAGPPRPRRARTRAPEQALARFLTTRWVPWRRVPRCARPSTDAARDGRLELRVLDERDRDMFVASAVLAGGATIAASEQITGASLDVLESLLAKSLLVRRGRRLRDPRRVLAVAWTSGRRARLGRRGARASAVPTALAPCGPGRSARARRCTGRPRTRS